MWFQRLQIGWPKSLNHFLLKGILCSPLSITMTDPRFKALRFMGLSSLISPLLFRTTEVAPSASGLLGHQDDTQQSRV